MFILVGLAPSGLVQTAQAANCSYDTLVRSTPLSVTVQWSGTTVSTLYGTIEVWAHFTQVRFNCVDYYHYVKIYTNSPNFWSLKATTNYVYGWWTIQIPSWSTIGAVGTYGSTVCTQYMGVSSGGVGTSSVQHYVKGLTTTCWPYQTWDSIQIYGFQTNIWHSNQYGQSYLVYFYVRYQDPGHGIDITSYSWTTTTS